MATSSHEELLRDPRKLHSYTNDELLTAMAQASSLERAFKFVKELHRRLEAMHDYANGLAQERNAWIRAAHRTKLDSGE